MPGGFASALREHAREVQKLEGKQAEEFLRLLRELQDTLRGRMMALAPDDATFDAYKLQAILGETQRGIQVLEDKAGIQYTAAEKEAAEMSIGHIVDEVDRLSKTFDKEPAVITIDAAKVLADPGQRLLANHFDSSVEKYGIDLLNGVRQRLFIGMRAGDTFGTIVSAVAGKAGPFGPIGKASGERLVRTETSQAYGAAQHTGLKEAAKQVPALKKIWLHIGSYRCDVCMPLHGSMRPLDGTWTIHLGERTKQVAHAPAHPNCVCRVSAMKEAWKKGMQKLGYLQQDPEDKHSSPAQL